MRCAGLQIASFAPARARLPLSAAHNKRNCRHDRTFTALRQHARQTRAQLPVAADEPVCGPCLGWQSMHTQWLWGQIYRVCQGQHKGLGLLSISQCQLLWRNSCSCSHIFCFFVFLFFLIYLFWSQEKNNNKKKKEMCSFLWWQCRCMDYHAAPHALQAVTSL